MRAHLIALCVLILAGCTEAPLVLVPEPSRDAIATDIFYATTRAQTPDGQFGQDRLEDPQFGRLTISIPKTSLLQRDADGQISEPRLALARFPRGDRGVDLSRRYGVLGQDGITDRAALISELKATLAENRARSAEDGQPRPQGVTLFVHGFNTPFGDAVYRLAQFAEDFDFSRSRGTIPVLFAWPSRGRLSAYFSDRESVLLEEMHLEALLNDIAAANPDFISIVAHSMGAQLTMQTLRRVAVRGNTELLSQLEPVFLLAPDIDVDVFANQVQDIGAVPQPFLVLTSRKDLALRFSALLRLGSERLGRAGPESPVRNLPIAIIDASALNDGNFLGHDLGFTSDTLIQLVACVGRFDQFSRQPGEGAKYIALSPAADDRQRICSQVMGGGAPLDQTATANP